MSRGILETTVFVALALILHLGIWSRMPSGTLAASGDGGEAVITMAAVTPMMVEMIEAFETPPEPVEAASTAALLPPVAPPPETASPLPPPDAPARPVILDMPRFDVQGGDLPLVQTPPPAPEPPKIELEPPVDLRIAALRPEPSRAPQEPTPDTPPRAEPVPIASQTRPPNPAALPLPAFEPPPPKPDAAGATSPRPPLRPDIPVQPAPSERRHQASPAPSPSQDAVPSNRAQEQSAEQRAVGSGGGEAAGNSGQSEVASLSSARRENLLANWGSKIRSRVERRKSHPRGVPGTGTATVRLIVTTEGRLADLVLAGSSGVAAFDEAALNAVRRAGRFVRAPRALGSGQHSFTLPIRFQN